jgi:hypothetical protein
MVQLLKKRFGELSIQLDQIGVTKQSKHSEYTGAYQEVDPELLLGWCVKARSLLVSACGKESEHFVAFVEAEKITAYGDNYGVYKRVKAVLRIPMVHLTAHRLSVQSRYRPAS